MLTTHRQSTTALPAGPHNSSSLEIDALLILDRVHVDRRVVVQPQRHLTAVRTVHVRTAHNTHPNLDSLRGVPAGMFQGRPRATNSRRPVKGASTIARRRTTKF